MKMKKTAWMIFLGIAVIAIGFFVLAKSERKIVLEQSLKEENQGLAEVSMEEKKEGLEEYVQKDEAIENIQAQEEAEKKEAFVESEESVDASKEAEEKESSTSLSLKNKLVSFGFTASGGRKIDTVIIHSSYNPLGGDEYDTEKIIEIYKEYGVAAHYLIGRDGKILRLVEEKNIAYHAGVSQVPDGRKNVNDFSIGIEMVGNKTDGYTEKQYEVVSELVDDIKKRYKIKYVLGHKDIAPGRKDDPWNFDFSKVK